MFMLICFLRKLNNMTSYIYIYIYIYIPLNTLTSNEIDNLARCINCSMHRQNGRNSWILEGLQPLFK